MNVMSTVQALAAITDEGIFERLATAILREANPSYHALSHPGVNVSGKTVKSPLDGACFVRGAVPSHMVAAHHTITARGDLARKWLHDPSTVTPRKGDKPTAPAGDVIKTAKLVAEERTRTPDLRVTLVLTTNEEPGDELVREVEAAGRANGLEIDLWSRSRLAHVLDTNPSGQWLRYSFLGIKQQLLSFELLVELSRLSLSTSTPQDHSDAWVPRKLDEDLNTGLRRDVTFLVGGSGLGKSVACYRKLARHIQAGGGGIVLSHETLASELTIDQAIFTTLQRLHPTLARVGAPALSFCTPERPLLIIVEDVNRSGQAQALVEKLATWSRIATNKDGKDSSPNWRLVCPVRPEFLASLSEVCRKGIEPMVLAASGFSEAEGRDAVQARAKLGGYNLSALAAEEISRSLGHDPLLIALHDYSAVPNPLGVIRQYIEGCVSRAVDVAQEHPATDYREALRKLGAQMLIRRKLEPDWREINSWDALRGEPLRLLGRLAHRCELIRLIGPSHNQRLVFRHDRVREWLLADAAEELDQGNNLAQEVMEDPYLAEVMGAVLAFGQPQPNFAQRISKSNPLALLHALRLLGAAHGENREDILNAANQWLAEPGTHERANLHLRWGALAILAEADFPEVPALVRRFKAHTTNGQLARFRNGDISGGVELCMNIEPGVTAPWRDAQIEHAKLKYGRNLADALPPLLRRADLDSAARIGLLRLAGHLADPSLVSGIEASWIQDGERGNHLVDYLWAFGECCGDDAERYLGPVCDGWAALPGQPDTKGVPSQRDDLAADQLRWAFRKWPPTNAALDYFVLRGSEDDLRWPITLMLHGIDHPAAVLHLVRELAAIQRRLDGSDLHSPFAMSAKDEWQRAQENGNPMSEASRNLLLQLWQDETNDRHLRMQAFSLWSATQRPGDVGILGAVKPADQLSDRALAARLARGDKSAIPAMIDKLGGGNKGYWWHFGRYVWSPELSNALGEELDQRGTESKRTWGESLGSDWIIYEMIMRLPEREAERLLVKHWDHLQFCSYFVQAALYVSTPRLLEAAHASINDCTDPATLLKHIASHYGIRVKDRVGLVREDQVRALGPYVHLLSPIDIWSFWSACNDRGWFDTRRAMLDQHLSAQYRPGIWDREKAFLELDDMVAKERLMWMDRWLDDFMETGVSWGEIVSTLREWLEQRRTLDALRAVAAALVHRGSREDLGILKAYEGMQGEVASDLIADAEFAVRRRRIS